MTVAAIAGHRPEKIEDPEWVGDALGETFRTFGLDRIIQGFASGVDLWSAVVANNNNINVTGARPWAGHKPRKADEGLYAWVERICDKIVDVDPSPTYPGIWVYQKRNKWMIDNSDFLISVWDGDEKGGTWNAIEYAYKIGRDIYNCNPRKRVCDFLVSSTL